MPSTENTLQKRNPSNRTIVMDVDETICFTPGRNYSGAKPNVRVIEQLRILKQRGWRIVLYSARGMVTFKGEIEPLVAHHMPILENWLAKHKVPWDEICLGKPYGVLYVDDKAVTPDHFACMTEGDFARLE